MHVLCLYSVFCVSIFVVLAVLYFALKSSSVANPSNLLAPIIKILPTGYTIYRLDRPSRGGGVLLAVDKTIVSQQLSSPSNLELLLIRISLHHPINICLVYNPPNASAEYTQELINFLQLLPTDSSPVILMGDFNVPDINWSTLVGSTHFSNQFCDLIFDLNLSQIVDSPTHIQGNTLDLVLTNLEDSIHSLIVHNNNHQFISSDDHPILFAISYSEKTFKYNSPHLCL